VFGFWGNAVFGGAAGGFVTVDGVEEFKKHGGAAVVVGPGYLSEAGFFETLEEGDGDAGGGAEKARGVNELARGDDAAQGADDVEVVVEVGVVILGELGESGVEMDGVMEKEFEDRDGVVELVGGDGGFFRGFGGVEEMEDEGVARGFGGEESGPEDGADEEVGGGGKGAGVANRGGGDGEHGEDGGEGVEIERFLGLGAEVAEDWGEMGEDLVGVGHGLGLRKIPPVGTRLDWARRSPAALGFCVGLYIWY
jgi:hypothetical protein